MTEAIGFGRPVIATAVGGASEWIADGVNGFLCPVAEEGLLIGTLKRALEERHRWKDMGLAAPSEDQKKLDPRPARVFLEALQPPGVD